MHIVTNFCGRHYQHVHQQCNTFRHSKLPMAGILSSLPHYGYI